MISRRRQEKRTCYFRVTALLLLVIFVLTQFIYFSLWLPLIKSSIREERRRFDLELEQRLARERLREEQWQLEEEGRQRLGLYWDAPAAEEHCMTYNIEITVLSFWARYRMSTTGWRPVNVYRLSFMGRALSRMSVDGGRM